MTDPTPATAVARALLLTLDTVSCCPGDLVHGDRQVPAHGMRTQDRLTGEERR
ncbi:hypothetical protein [Streptomyces sp. cg35]|uniref:hypothetical protein n=1 Tax=Streptomyces sp. cg35 TaxID=3421650 RepID=UPI003D171F26